jgi:hypothetical protein
MPCDTKLRQGQTLAARNEEITRTLERLRKALSSGSVKAQIGPNGAIAFAGWNTDRSDITDVCAFRTLTAASSWELRQAVQRAEGQSGRKVNVNAVGAGVHSHDGGHSWHKGH